MSNADIAERLGEIAELLELKGEGRFRIRAYENGARVIENLNEDVRVLLTRDELVDVKGIGDGLAKKIAEYVDTGHMRYLDALRSEFPEGVRSLMAVPGIGPSIARRVYKELGIESLDGLRSAASDGRLASLPGLGEKSAENVIRALSRVNKRDSRISIGKALPVVEELIEQLRVQSDVANLTPAGSLRRWSPTIGDIDLMATSSVPQGIMDAFVNLPQVVDVLGQGSTKSSIVTTNRLQVDLRIVEEDAFGSLVQHFTGSRQHNIELREYALRRGLSLNEYGIASKSDGSRQQFANETDFYEALGLAYIPPELREGNGEIDAARTGTLPTLLEVGDMRGDLHSHTEWSDGSVPIETMVEAAKSRGYEYLAITDHSGGIGVAGGLHVDRLLEQVARLREIDQSTPGIKILAGSEVDIRRDGSLDFPDEILAQLDWVIASVHSGFNQTSSEMTARIIRAIENPFVRAIAHPTGRLIGKREPYEVDMEAVFQAAARTRTVLEINSFPERLDLSDLHARRAIQLGVTLAVNTDAHAPSHFDNIRYGVAVARRAWAEQRNVLNTFSLSDLLAYLKHDEPSP